MRRLYRRVSRPERMLGCVPAESEFAAPSPEVPELGIKSGVPENVLCFRYRDPLRFLFCPPRKQHPGFRRFLRVAKSHVNLNGNRP